MEEYKVSDVHEISVDYNGWSHIVIYGRHKNGWFCAIPNWRKCTEISLPEDEGYNWDKICDLLDDSRAAEAIAAAIKEHHMKVMQAR